MGTLLRYLGRLVDLRLRMQYSALLYTDCCEVGALLHNSLHLAGVPGVPAGPVGVPVGVPVAGCRVPVPVGKGCRWVCRCRWVPVGVPAGPVVCRWVPVGKAVERGGAFAPLLSGRFLLNVSFQYFARSQWTLALDRKSKYCESPAAYSD